MKRQSGNHSSKYALNPEQLGIDIQNKILDHKACRQAIKDIILANPSKMKLRYYDAIDALKELKEEYGL